jgi:uncharacterized membrane-anchored protein
LALLIALGLMAPGFAAPPPASQADLEAQQRTAWTDAAKTATRGPAEIKLLDEATLHLTEDEAFVPAAEANKVMEALGNQVSEARYGLIVSRKPDTQWMIDVKWVKEGYVRDGDAKEWQADALLDSLREGTESGNTERLARGLPALAVIGWVEPPAYDSAMHRLVWSLSLRIEGAPADQPQTINYNTYALGRDGFFSLDLITGSDTVAADKDVVRQLLGTLTYAQGKRYEDFDQSTDKVAAYGLAALIGAVAVKKLGLLALAAAFFVKIWKLGMIAVIAGFAGLRRFLKGRRRSVPDSSPPASPPAMS